MLEVSPRLYSSGPRLRCYLDSILYSNMSEIIGQARDITDALLSRVNYLPTDFIDTSALLPAWKRLCLRLELWIQLSSKIGLGLNFPSQ
jgi:hypothetical protein